MSTFGIGPISIAGLVSTSDDVTLTMKLTALDPSKFTIPTAIAAPRVGAARRTTARRSRRSIMPTLQANCASCHNPGQVGAAHWTLDTAADAADDLRRHRLGRRGRATCRRGRRRRTASRCSDSKRLDQATIDAIVKWSRAGGPLDVPGVDEDRAEGRPAVPTPRNDVVLQMPQAYAGSLSVPNDYRCFVLDPHITKPTYITGYQVTPDHRAEIHHVQIFHIDASQVAAGRQDLGQRRQAGLELLRHGRSAVDRSATPRRRTAFPGFTGQAGLIAGWVPGQDPVVYPEHSGILLQPGDALVLQVHYHYDTTPVPDRTTVAIQTDPGTANFKKIDIINPIAPVEIPCMPGATAPLCDRNAALADDVHLYGADRRGRRVRAARAVRQDRRAARRELPQRRRVVDAATTTVPESGTIVSVFGHEHTLGKTFRFTLDPDTPKPTVLLDIPTWNFDWQMNYGLAQADPRQRRPDDPDGLLVGPVARSRTGAPKYIVFAEGTEDEMCFSTYAIIPDNQSP